uniref:Uncharacterized protein n=1 Tax=Oryza rufipogon TaxID=4529 RepID=A0A0E0NRT6_ORYRU
MARPEVETAVRLGAADPAPLWPDLASPPTDPVGTLDLRGGRLSLGVEGMAWWSGDGRCAGWLCGVLMGNRWRKPCQAMGWHDDSDAIWRRSPHWRRRPGIDPS